MSIAATEAMQFDWTGMGSEASYGRGPQLESKAFRDDHYDFFNAFLDSIREHVRLPSWYREPVDVLEAARMELLQLLRPAVRDWTAWQRIYELRAPRVVVHVPGDVLDVVARDRDAMQPPFDVRLIASSSTAPPRKSRLIRPLRNAAYQFVHRLESRWIPRQRFPHADAARSRVILIDQFPNSTQIMVPLWHHLSVDLGYQCLYLAGREKVRRELQRQGVAGPNLLRCEPRVPARLLTPPSWSNLVGEFFERLAEQSGMPTPPSVLRGFCAAAELLEEIKLNALRLQRAFERFRPHYFYISSGLHAQAHIGELLCKQYECVDVHLQHGLYQGDKSTQNLLSDAVCLWGDFHRRLLEQNPCPARPAVTGSPKHDALRRKYAETPQSPRPLVAFYSSRRASVLIGAQEFDRHLAAFYAAARAMPDVEFVVKLHPAEYRDVVAGLDRDPLKPANMRVTLTDDAYELLQRCHVAMTVSSTIGYEALLFRRPLVLLNLTNRPDELPLSDGSAAARVTDADDLPQALRQALSQPSHESLTVDDFWLNDGRAIERIVVLSEEIRKTKTMSNGKTSI